MIALYLVPCFEVSPLEYLANPVAEESCLECSSAIRNSSARTLQYFPSHFESKPPPYNTGHNLCSPIPTDTSLINRIPLFVHFTINIGQLVTPVSEQKSNQLFSNDCIIIKNIYIFTYNNIC